MRVLEECSFAHQYSSICSHVMCTDRLSLGRICLPLAATLNVYPLLSVDVVLSYIWISIERNIMM
jgi:hypothetical protein